MEVLLKIVLKTLRDVRFRDARDMSRIVQKSARSQGICKDGYDAGLVPLDRYVEFIYERDQVDC